MGLTRARTRLHHERARGARGPGGGGGATAPIVQVDWAGTNVITGGASRGSVPPGAGALSVGALQASGFTRMAASASTKLA
jgi:hypothetical protein